MENRIKEIIAVGASITANCQPCLEYHVAKAREFGAREEEIRQAVAMGKMVRKSGQGKMDGYASALLQKDPPPAADAKEGCGCG